MFVGYSPAFPVLRDCSPRGGRTTSLNPFRAPALCVLAVIGAACGGAARSLPPTTTIRPVTSASLEQVVRAGQLVLQLPSSWSVGSGICRCGWEHPTGNVGQRPAGGGVLCSCSMEEADAASGLHLYEGSTGLIQGGKPEVVNGLQALVSVDTTTATMTATFREWISGSRSARPRLPAHLPPDCDSWPSRRRSWRRSRATRAAWGSADPD